MYCFLLPGSQMLAQRPLAGQILEKGIISHLQNLPRYTGRTLWHSVLVTDQGQMQEVLAVLYMAKH